MPRVFEPAYLPLLDSGELATRVSHGLEHLACCDLCARYCRVNRHETINGAVCRTGRRAVVHSCGAHHGEERPLRGWRGSGTIFFSWKRPKSERKVVSRKPPRAMPVRMAMREHGATK